MPFSISLFLMGSFLDYCPLFLVYFVYLLLCLFLAVLCKMTATMAVSAFERELFVIQFLDVFPPSNSELNCFRQTLF